MKKRGKNVSGAALFLIVALLVLEAVTAVKLIAARRALRKYDGPDYMTVQTAYSDGVRDGMEEARERYLEVQQ